MALRHGDQLYRSRGQIYFKKGKRRVSGPCLTIISLFRRKSVSGLANKTCTGTSKRYQLCKVQVRISFFSLGTLDTKRGKSCLLHVMALLGPSERRHRLSCNCHPIAPPSNCNSCLWCPSPSCRGFGPFACPEGHKTQRAVLAPSPGGLPLAVPAVGGGGYGSGWGRQWKCSLQLVEMCQKPFPHFVFIRILMYPILGVSCERKELSRGAVFII